MRTIITLSTLLFTVIVCSQLAPTTGKKTLEVKATYEEEYLQPVTKGDLAELLLTQMRKNVIKKAAKFGFIDITIEAVGKVWYPQSVSSKISLETPTAENWKFQANIMDNTTGNRYKLRIALFGHTPKYIIKEPTAAFYCSQISKEGDKFTDKTTLQSPFDAITLYKLITNERQGYFASLRVAGNTLNIGKKGVVLLFEDGTKINKPNEKIKATVGEGTTYNYDATFDLSAEEVEQIKNKRITDIRLFIYDKQITNGESYIKYMHCLTK